MYDPIVSLFFRSVEPLYRWFSENLLGHLMTFGKEFGALIIFISAVAFLLITIYFVMKQAKKLPQRYVIETFDQNGMKTVIPELRIKFGTYQAAASYAEMYTELFKYKYKFRLLGIKSNISTLRRLHH
jgi:hypothetical protein